ncbi:hypothetical protein C6A85_16765, partial [Mycobacterium sp. ITM-2017-0098]
TPRTVQYMFRKHLDTTPTAYLRAIRLKRAREELIASDRTITTAAAMSPTPMSRAALCSMKSIACSSRAGWPSEGLSSALSSGR